MAEKAEFIAPADLFLLNPKHSSFSVERKIYDDTLAPTFFISVFLIIFGVIALQQNLQLASSNLDVSISIGPLFFGAGLLFLFTYFQMRHELRLLSQDGKILFGQIRKSRVNGAKNGFITTINYDFALPSGKILKGEQWQSRKDIRTKTDLPVPGTPVEVVYANDKVYRVL